MMDSIENKEEFVYERCLKANLKRINGNWIKSCSRKKAVDNTFARRSLSENKSILELNEED